MPGQLDEVADRLAEQPLAIRHSTNRLVAYADERSGLVRMIAGLVGALAMVVSLCRRIMGLPDARTTRRLYEQATGVDRDRANADLALVADRLSPLVNAPDGARGDDLVLAASRRLVAWVAAGRTADKQMSAVETAFSRWVQTTENDAAAPDATVETTESYIDAWATALRPIG